MDEAKLLARRRQRLQELRQRGVLYDDDDEVRLLNYTWRLHPHGYVTASGVYADEPATVLMHRVVLQTDAPLIDHIDRNGLDNRKCNLRIATCSDNQLNSDRCDYAKLVYPRDGRFRIVIQRGGQVFDRTYATHAEAVAAAEGYDAAFQRYSKET